MTEQEQRIAIAEACGWSPIENSKGLHWNEKEHIAAITPGSEVEKARVRIRLGPTLTLPDYPHDLNAMHEAEKELLAEQKVDYLIWLAKLNNKAPTFSTADQRSEAFLRTIGKWKD